MLHDHEIALIIIGDPELVQERISGLAHNHGAEELASKPSSTPWSNTRLNDRYLQIGASLAKHICRTETTRPSANDDDIGLGIGVEVIEVTAGHSTGYLRLADRSKLEALVPLVGHFSKGLSLVGADGNCLDVKLSLHLVSVDGGGRLFKHGGRRRHDVLI